MSLEGYAFIADLLGSVRLADAAAKDPLIPGGAFQIAKAGTFFSTVYGKITISPDDLATMYRNFKTRTPLSPTQLPIDFDHLSDDPQKPGDGRAAGWIQDLELKPDDTLWATPKWTRVAAAMIANGEYRWCSPFFITDYMDKASGKKIGPTLKAVAVTNRPFLEGMQPIPAPAIAASDTIAKQFRGYRNVAVSRRYRLGQPSITKGAKDMRTCTACNKALSEAAIAFAEEESGTPGAITCPHCGAPVKYQVEAAPGAEDMKDAPPKPPPHAAPPPPAAAPPAPPHAAPPAAKVPPAADKLDEGGGDADALEELDDKVPMPPPQLADVPAPEMDDAPAAEMIEPASGDKSHPANDAAKTQELDDSSAQPKTPVVAASEAREISKLREQVRQLSDKNAVTEKALKDVQRVQRREVAEQLTSRGLREGKLTPKLIGTWQKPGWALAEAYNRPKSFDSWLRNTAPIVVDLSERGTGKDALAEAASHALADRIDRLAKEKVAANPKLSYADAVRSVNVEHRALADEYDREMSVGSERTTSVSSSASAIR